MVISIILSWCVWGSIAKYIMKSQVMIFSIMLFNIVKIYSKCGSARKHPLLVLSKSRVNKHLG